MDYFNENLTDIGKGISPVFCFNSIRFTVLVSDPTLNDA